MGVDLRAASLHLFAALSCWDPLALQSWLNLIAQATAALHQKVIAPGLCMCDIKACVISRHVQCLPGYYSGTRGYRSRLHLVVRIGCSMSSVFT